MSETINISRDGGRHVRMNGEQSFGCLQAHLVHDKCTPVSALSDVAGVAKALHQDCPSSAHALGSPASGRRLAGKTVAWH